jgi:hypothetical protein
VAVEPPVAPELVGADYVTGNSITLTFDVAVEVGGIDPAAITVVDANLSERFAGNTVTAQPTPQSVAIALVSTGAGFAPRSSMSATAANGIVAVDGLAWPGVGLFPLF